MLRAVESATSKPRRESTALRETSSRLQALGVRLRLMWDDIVQEPIPDDMMELLRQLDRLERKSGVDR